MGKPFLRLAEVLLRDGELVKDRIQSEMIPSNLNLKKEKLSLNPNPCVIEDSLDGKSTRLSFNHLLSWKQNCSFTLKILSQQGMTRPFIFWVR